MMKAAQATKVEVASQSGSPESNVSSSARFRKEDGGEQEGKAVEGDNSDDCVKKAGDESEDDPACNEEAKAQADAHADRANEETHPGCHGEQIGADGDGRTYHVTGDDLRVYRWEKSKGRAHPAWSTACTTTSEALALANAFAESKSPKERALGTYLLETHLPAHLAEEEKRALALCVAMLRRFRAQIGDVYEKEILSALNGFADDARVVLGEALSGHIQGA